MRLASDEKFMQMALWQAKLSAEKGDIPIGAVLVRGGQVMAEAHNGSKANRLAHAEKLVIEQIIEKGEVYLYDYTLYVTIEPCVMCSGIIQWARVGTVVYGADDPKSGAMGSLYDIAADSRLNHNPVVRKGVLEEECGDILRDYFRAKRIEKSHR